MSNLNLIIENSAESDMTTIAEYIAKDKKSTAVKMLQLFYDSFSKLSIYPGLGFSRPDFTYNDVKFFVVKRRYLVVYKTTKEEIHILRVLSAYQDICALLWHKFGVLKLPNYKYLFCS